MTIAIADDTEIPTSVRDSITELAEEEQTPPVIVSLSDIHGYLEEARSALLTLEDSSMFDPVVISDDVGNLHWAGENYVLVFNGDLIDRGPANDEVLEMVARLIDEAPPGRVRVTLGNHEAIILSTDHLGFSNWYSGKVCSADRQKFLTQILDGHVIAAYEGYNVTYAHAGSPVAYDTSTVNKELIGAAHDLLEAIGTPDEVTVQRQVLDDYKRVLGVGKGHLKAPGAGLVWLDFGHIPSDAPTQVVGHTRHQKPRKKGNVYCQNVIRENIDNNGGEVVFIETSETLSALARRADGGTDLTEIVSFDS